MTDQEHAKSIFLDALDHADGDRSRFIEARCEGDLKLAQRVLKLLATHDEADSVFHHGEMDTQSSPLNVSFDDAVSSGSTLDLEPGATIGPYVVVDTVGEGGFGVVYEAEQIEPVCRRVAIKIIKLGMDTKQVIARFEAERQALAMMEHPNIANVFDAGATETGRPYFVMEFIDGEPITKYCDRVRLSIRARLEVFEQICLAVRHAHQKGVIHRDLKPTNILVTDIDGKPSPKIIDFGIAKAAGESMPGQTLVTIDRQLLGTPEYMSPEQATLGGGDVDTRTDIYSLGVLLYELITGSSPYDRKRLRNVVASELERIIRDERPPRPSTRVGELGEYLADVAADRRADPARFYRELRGELDWIVMRAIEKDRDRRYQSASEFAEDVRHFLDDQPVNARPPSSLYLTGKFIRRHRVTAAAILMVAVSLIVGVVFATTGLRQANTQRGIAEDALTKAEDRLWDSYVAQARAKRESQQPGRRFESLEVLRQAAQIRTSMELRNEAVACATLSDVKMNYAIATPSLGVSNGLHTVDRYAISPAEGVIVVASADDGRELARLEGPGGIAYVLTFSPDGKYIAIKYQGDSLWVWDIAAQSAVLEIPEGGFRADGVAFDQGASPPRWVCLAQSDNAAHFYALPDGHEIDRVETETGWVAFAVDPSGSQLAVTNFSWGTVSIFDLERDRERTLEPPALVLSLAWSRDGATLAGGAQDRNIYLWDTETWEQTKTLVGHDGQPFRVMFGPHPGVLASSGWDGTTRLWDIHAGRELLEPISQWSASAFGDRIAASTRGKIGFWQFEPGAEYLRLRGEDHEGSRSRVAFHPNSKWLALGGRHGLEIWNALTGDLITTVTTDEVYFPRFTPDGGLLVAPMPDKVCAWPFAIEADAPVIGERDVLFRGPDIRTGNLSTLGDKLLVVSGDGIRVINLQTRQIEKALPYYRGLNDQTPWLSADGQWLFTGTWKGEPARVWDLETGEIGHEFPGPHVIARFSPDGTRLLVGTGREFVLHTTGDWRERWRYRRQWSGDVAGPLAFSADGRTIALAHSRTALALVDADTGEAFMQFEDPIGVAQFEFDANGGRLAVARSNSMAHILNLNLIRRHLDSLGLDWSSDPLGVGRQ